VWNEPFAPYSKPLSSKAKSKLARQATKAAQDPSSTPPPAQSTTDSTPSLPPRRLINHFVMNLPALAIEFLDAFRGLYRPLYELEGAQEAVEEAGEAALPMVHCYCFTKSPETAEEDILEVGSASPCRSLKLTLILFNFLSSHSEPPKRSACPSLRKQRITASASCETLRRGRRCTASSSGCRSR
jgi:hypothetical protein